MLDIVRGCLGCSSMLRHPSSSRQLEYYRRGTRATIDFSCVCVDALPLFEQRRSLGRQRSCTKRIIPGHEHEPTHFFMCGARDLPVQ